MNSYANKPGVSPGRPLPTASVNDVRHICRILARDRGIPLHCGSMTRIQGRMAAKAMLRYRPEFTMSQDRHGAIVLHFGGAR